MPLADNTGQAAGLPDRSRRRKASTTVNSACAGRGMVYKNPAYWLKSTFARPLAGSIRRLCASIRARQRAKRTNLHLVRPTPNCPAQPPKLPKAVATEPRCRAGPRSKTVSFGRYRNDTQAPRGDRSRNPRQCRTDWFKSTDRQRFFAPATHPHQIKPLQIKQIKMARAMLGLDRYPRPDWSDCGPASACNSLSAIKLSAIPAGFHFIGCRQHALNHPATGESSFDQRGLLHGTG